MLTRKRLVEVENMLKTAIPSRFELRVVVNASPKNRFQYFGIFETWFSVLPHLQNLVSSTSASPKHGFQHTVRMYILHIALAHLHMDAHLHIDAHLHMRFDENRSMCIIKNN